MRRTESVIMVPRSPNLTGYPRSDTLFGAICWGIRLTNGSDALEGLLDRFKRRDPPFLISSSFPCQVKEGQVRYLLPMPLFSPPSLTVAALHQRWKAFKRIKWVDLELFMRMLNGNVGPEHMLKQMRLEKNGSGEQQWMFEKYAFDGGCLSLERIHPSRMQEMVGNSVNRLTNRTDENFFFYSAHQYEEGSASFFLISYEDDCQHLIDPALALLEDRGIGGKVSTGKGAVRMLRQKIHEPLGSDGDTFLNLSTYIPLNEEIQYFREAQQTPSYALIARRGLVESAFAMQEAPWKKRVLCFGEGSLFPVIKGREHYGHNPIVHSDRFPVQQYGFAFPVKGVMPLGH